MADYQKVERYYKENDEYTKLSQWTSSNSVEMDNGNTLETENKSITSLLQNNASKNLLQNTATSQTVNGVTFTVNDDGSVTCNGTATSNAIIDVSFAPSFDDGTYILSGCPEGGGNTTYMLYYANWYDTSYEDVGNGIEIKPFDVSAYPNARVRIKVSSGVTVSNLTFYPMIRKAEITDDTYEPYYMNNKELTETLGTDGNGNVIADTYATNTSVDTKIANLVDSAPETMNTLKELSDAIAEHEDITDALNEAIGTKVNKTDIIDASHGGTGQTSLNTSSNALLNALTVGESTPSDNDYYISQYVNGGTTTTTYHRRPMSALWSYIQGKFYEEGTFTPSVNPYGTVSSVSGNYKKVGNLVYFHVEAVLSAENYIVAVRDLPFVPKNEDCYGHLSVLIDSSTQLGGVAEYANYMGASPSVNTTDFTYLNKGKIFRFVGIYETE